MNLSVVRKPFEVARRRKAGRPRGWRPPQPGEVRSVTLVGYFAVPWDFPEARVDWPQHVREFAETWAKAGFRFERVLQIREEPIPTLFTEGGAHRVYNIVALFSRPAVKYVFEVPDAMADRLVASGEFKRV